MKPFMNKSPVMSEKWGQSHKRPPWWGGRTRASQRAGLGHHVCSGSQSPCRPACPSTIFFFPTMSVAPLVVADRKYSENKNIMDLNWAADRGCEEPAKVKAAQSCLTLWDPMDYTVPIILQARILEWVAFPFSRGSSQPRNQTHVPCIVGRFFTSWATREARALQRSLGISDTRRYFEPFMTK